MYLEDNINMAAHYMCVQVHFLTSPYCRTMETMDHILEAFSDKQVWIKKRTPPECELCELQECELCECKSANCLITRLLFI